MKSLLALAVVATLAGCGGGSASGVTPQVQVAPALVLRTPIPTPSPSPSPTALPSGSITINAPYCPPGGMWPSVLNLSNGTKRIGVLNNCGYTDGDVMTIVSTNPAAVMTPTTAHGSPYYWIVSDPTATYTITDTSNGNLVVITPTTVTSD
jgi:hypothetical protein